MLKKDEKELLDTLLYKKTMPYCMGKYTQCNNICSQCGFNEVCYIVQKENIDEYIIEDKSVPNKQVLIGNNIDAKKFVTEIKQLVTKFKSMGYDNEKVISEITNCGYKISNMDTFKRCFL